MVAGLGALHLAGVVGVHDHLLELALDHVNDLGRHDDALFLPLDAQMLEQQDDCRQAVTAGADHEVYGSSSPARSRV